MIIAFLNFFTTLALAAAGIMLTIRVSALEQERLLFCSRNKPHPSEPPIIVKLTDSEKQQVLEDYYAGQPNHTTLTTKHRTMEDFTLQELESATMEITNMIEQKKQGAAASLDPAAVE